MKRKIYVVSSFGCSDVYFRLRENAFRYYASMEDAYCFDSAYVTQNAYERMEFEDDTVIAPIY